MGLNACQDVIQLDLPDGDTFLTVDGWLTTLTDTLDVQLTTNANYFSDGNTPRVTNATVFLMEDGNEFPFTHDENGLYRLPITGRLGATYELRILWDNKEYRSNPQIIPRGALIDSIYYEKVEDDVFGPPRDESIINRKPGDEYNLLHDFKDVEGTDYYRWRHYRNDTLMIGNDNLAFTDDRFFDGDTAFTKKVGIFSPFYETDTLILEQMTIPKEAFDFLSILRDQSSTGGLFGTPPAPIKGNIYEVGNEQKLVLGFFGVANSDTASIIIKPIPVVAP